jgi:glycosyltransferase involved in cell wall biosynthesis
MRITWSLPLRGPQLNDVRGDRVRARALISSLEAAGDDVHVVEDVARAGGRAPISIYRRWLRPVMPRGLALLVRDVGRWCYAQGHGRHVAQAAREQRSDMIVETQVNFAASGALAARLTGIPLVLDDCSPSVEERLLGAALPSLARRLLRAQASAAALVIAVSDAARDRLVTEGVPAEKIRLLPNGIDLARYRGADRAAARARLHLQSHIVVGFAGSFQPWHQVDLLIRALARRRTSRPMRVVLVGDGPGRAATVALARRLEVPCLDVGPVTAAELPALVSAFDIGVVPGSNDYGQPMKLLDYAAAAAAPVAPDLPPVREMLQHEVTGLLFPAGDADALAAVVDRLAENDGLRIALGKRARRQVAEPASWQTRAHTLASWLAAVTGRRAEPLSAPC